MEQHRRGGIDHNTSVAEQSGQRAGNVIAFGVGAACPAMIDIAFADGVNGDDADERGHGGQIEDADPRHEIGDKPGGHGSEQVAGVVEYLVAALASR